jgi:hypothetical protein
MADVIPIGAGPYIHDALPEPENRTYFLPDPLVFHSAPTYCEIIECNKGC